MRTQFLVLALLHVLFKAQAGKIIPKRHANPEELIWMDPRHGSDAEWTSELCFPHCIPVSHVITPRHTPSMKENLMESLMSVFKMMGGSHGSENEHHHSLTKKDTKSELKALNIEDMDEYNQYSHYKTHPRNIGNSKNTDSTTAINTEVLKQLIQTIVNGKISIEPNQNSQSNEFYDNGSTKTNNELRNKNVIRINKDQNTILKQNRNPNKRQIRYRKIATTQTTAGVDNTTEQTNVETSAAPAESDLYQNTPQSNEGREQRSSLENVHVGAIGNTNNETDEYTSSESREGRTHSIEHSNLVMANDDENNNIATSVEPMKHDLFGENFENEDDAQRKYIARSIDAESDDLLDEKFTNAGDEKVKDISKSTEYNKSDDLFDHEINNTNDKEPSYIVRSVEFKKDDLLHGNYSDADDPKHKTIARSTESQIEHLFVEDTFNADSEEHKNIPRSLESLKDDLFVENRFNTGAIEHKNVARSTDSQEDDLFPKIHNKTNNDEQYSITTPNGSLEDKFQSTTSEQSILHNYTSAGGENSTRDLESIPMYYEENEEIHEGQHINKQDKAMNTSSENEEGLENDEGLNIYELNQEPMYAKNQIPRHVSEEDSNVATMKPEENFPSIESSDRVSPHEQNSNDDINIQESDVSNPVVEKSYEIKSIFPIHDTNNSTGEIDSHENKSNSPIQTSGNEDVSYDKTENGSSILNDELNTDDNNNNDESQIQRTGRETPNYSIDKNLSVSEENGLSEDLQVEFIALEPINDSTSVEDQNKGTETEEDSSTDNGSGKNRTSSDKNDSLSREVLTFNKDTTGDEKQDPSTTKNVRHISFGSHNSIKSNKEVSEHSSEFLNFQLNSKFPFNCLSLRLASKNSENNEYILSPWNSEEGKKGNPVHFSCYVPYSMMKNLNK